MSMICCKICGDFLDSDEFSEGFYVIEYPDDYVCAHCVENNNLTYEGDTP